MKKSNTLLFEKHALGILLPMALFLSPMSLQARHMVLHEKFTNKGCGPCAEFAPLSDALLERRMEDVVAITWHGNYPSPYDDLYLAEKEVADARIALYGVSSYPSVYLDGESVYSSVSAIEARINELLSATQTVDINLSTSVSDGAVEVHVAATPLAGLPAGGRLRLFVAAVEETLYSQPGSNRQTEFLHEFRGFICDNDGYDAAALLDGGQVVFESSWDTSPLDNPDELAVVAWIQDMETGKVLEAAYAPKTSGLTESAKIIEASSEITSVCFPYWKGRLSFRNTGSNPIHDCDIEVNINGYVKKTHWQGNLPYLAKADIDLPLFSDFEFAETPAETPVSLCVTAINGTEAMSNLVECAMENAPEATNSIQLAIFTDSRPQEITWRIVDADGKEQASGGPYEQANRRYEETPVLGEGCHALIFNDSGGDGIKSGHGYYTIYNYDDAGKRRMLLQGDYDGAEHIVFFSLTQNDISEVEKIASAGVAYDRQSRRLTLPSEGEVAVTDLSGKLIFKGKTHGRSVVLPDTGGSAAAVSYRCEDVSGSAVVVL